MKRFLVQLSQWPLLLFLFLGTATCLYLFQEAQASLSQLAGEEVVLMDSKINYTQAEIQAFLEQIGAEGRSIHQQTTGVLDMLFPIVYGLFFILLAAFLIQHIWSTTSNTLYGALLPILLVMVDYKENFQILYLLQQYPNLTSAMVEQAAQWTGVKHALLLFFLIGIGLLFLIRILKKLKSSFY